MRPTRAASTASVVLSLCLVASLAACTPGSPAPEPDGEPWPSTDGIVLAEVLGVDPGPDHELLEQTLGERIADAVVRAEDAAAGADRELRAAVFDEPTAAKAPAPGAAPAIAVQSSALGRAGVPGLDRPIVTQSQEVSDREIGGRPATRTTTASGRIEQQVETTTLGTVETVGDPATDGARESVEATTRKTVCEKGAEVSGEFEVDRVQTVTRNGETTEIRMRFEGRFERRPDGTVDLRGVRATLDSSTGSGGTTTARRHIEVAVEVNAWDPEQSITETRGEFRAVELPEGMDADEAVAAAVLAFSAYEDVVEGAVERAQKLREEGGLCVRIQVDTHGVHELAEGDTTPFDAWVVEVATGEVIADAPLEAGGMSSRITPDSGVGRTTFDFTARGKPSYLGILTTTTPLGGHSALLQFNAPGWRFEGVSYDYIVDTVLGPVGTSSVWSGRVCGVFNDEWEVTVLVTSPVASHGFTLPMTPARLDSPPGGERAILLYEEVEEPAPGEPPFRLWTDEVNSERSPTHSRVEIHPEPLDEVCLT
ncbi:hypothetical protein H4J02_05385 [Protaetiibacter sp. SSC-01]|uniref:hypothetical protein n=1 Tax=Protaetiibacter sp. SSC-01 TaxID=2759943 RepID=UPI001656F577|nr:hypothetical protein [Protaetiibacter sp. SSC-01]QNO38438.1 hypothetical protein H4J02_05385 [Protaetiibacter sp. SSC-01]